MRMSGKNPEFRVLIQPVSGLSHAAQEDICAKYPGEVYVCRTEEELDGFLKHLRPPRIVVVSHGGLIAHQTGSKDDRVDAVAAMKTAIHRRGCFIIEASTDRRSESDKAWKLMKRDAGELCRRLAQGRKSALNGHKGAKPLDFSDRHLSRFVIEMRTPATDAIKLKNIASYCKANEIAVPGRTWLKTKLIPLARSRGLVE